MTVEYARHRIPEERCGGFIEAYGSHYDPFIPFVILTVMAAIVVFLWGGKTLAGRTTVAIA